MVGPMEAWQTLQWGTMRALVETEEEMAGCCWTAD
jgi:hypothetical protein